MATTRTNVQAGMVYRETQDAIRHELTAIRDLMNAHEQQATPHGIHWGHIGDLADVLARLQQITQPNA